MKRFKNILVFIDNDDEENITNNYMLKKAKIIARLNNAKITVFGAIKEGNRSIDLNLEKKLKMNIRDVLLDQKKKFLDGLVRSFLKKEDVNIETKVLVGVAFIALIRHVLKEDQPLLMIGGSRVQSLKDRIFGTTSLHLLRKCPCPVWVFKPSKRSKFNRILVSVDTGSEFESEQELNIKLMEFGTSLSELENAKLYVLHAWVLFGESLLRGHFAGLTNEEVDNYIIDAETTANQNFNNFLTPFRNSINDKNRHCINGDPTVLVPHFIKENKIDLIIMGTVGRTGLQGFFIGNTAERILESVNCSVLAVKPDGFKTPVTLE